MARDGEIGDFCQRFWDVLFESIERCEVLTRRERRIYRFLWRHVDVRTRIYERPLGIEAVARRLDVSEGAMDRALDALCRKGFCRKLEAQPRRPLRYALNPLLIEAAFEETKHLFRRAS